LHGLGIIDKFNWLLREPVAEFFVYGIGNKVAGSGEVIIGMGGFVNEYESGFVADADAVDELAGKASLLDEPAGVDFNAVEAAMNRDTALGDVKNFLFGDVDIFEEGAGASLFFGVGEFVGADSGNHFADIGWGENSLVVVENVFFDGIIKWAFHTTNFKSERDRNNKITIFLGSVENALAIGKAEIFF